MITDFDIITSVPASQAVMSVAIFRNVTGSAISAHQLYAQGGLPRTQTATQPLVIEGTGSLQIQFFVSGAKGTIKPKDSIISVHPTTGNIQTRIGVASPTNGTYAFGLYCLANNSNIVSGVGDTANTYALMFLRGDGAASSRIALTKSSSGISINATVLSFADNIWTAPIGQLFVAQLSWKTSGANVELVGKYGNNTDTLSTVISYVDNASPFTTSASGEGFWVETGTTNSVQISFDDSIWAATF